jgi:D-3-phosphoglycerate dehydrogenase
MIDVLEGRPAAFAVNAPPISAEAARTLGPYVRLAQVLGNLATQLAEGQMRSITVEYSGEIAEHDTTALRASVIRGLLQSVSEETVTVVNASLVARNRGLRVSEQKNSSPERYANLIRVKLQTEGSSSVVAGTILEGEPRVVGIDEYTVDLVPSDGYVLVSHHVDQPGMVAQLGDILWKANINISSMRVGRERMRGPAVMLVSVDEPIPSETLQRIREVPGFEFVRVVRI